MRRELSRITMTTLTVEQNFFLLFNLPRTFVVDQTLLTQQYLSLQSRYHPDRAAHLDDATKASYSHASTHINEAYQTLKHPLKRARYLLTLEGIDTEEETNTSMPGDFLMAQMEWREAIETASQTKNLPALEKLHQDILHLILSIEEQLTESLDQQHDTVHAAILVRQYRFFERLIEEISDAIEATLI